MMKTYEKPASQMFEMHTSGALLALSVVSGGSARRIRRPFEP